MAERYFSRLCSSLAPFLRSAFVTPLASAFCVCHSPRFCVVFRRHSPLFCALRLPLVPLLRCVLSWLNNFCIHYSLPSAFCIRQFLYFCVLYSQLARRLLRSLFATPRSVFANCPLLHSAFAAVLTSAFCVLLSPPLLYYDYFCALQ